MITTASSPFHVAIIGAGIGGLACAISLRRQGIRVTVLERAPEILEVILPRSPSSPCPSSDSCVARLVLGSKSPATQVASCNIWAYLKTYKKRGPKLTSFTFVDIETASCSQSGRRGNGLDENTEPPGRKLRCSKLPRLTQNRLITSSAEFFTAQIISTYSLQRPRTMELRSSWIQKCSQSILTPPKSDWSMARSSRLMLSSEQTVGYKLFNLEFDYPRG